MRRLLLLTSLLILPLLTFAQNWNSVKLGKEYIWGEGYGNTIAEADQAALADLISKISLNVSFTTTQEEEEAIQAGRLDATSYFKSKTLTYSHASLNNTEKVIIQNEPDAHVGRWIKRSEVEKLFASRKAKIVDLIESAQRGEEGGKADDALRYYYWALILAKSLQNPNEMTYNDHVVMSWIPEQMNNIFSSIQASVVKREQDDVELYITYKGKPISSVDYTYFDGKDWSNIYSAKDGRGVLELAAGNASSMYQVKYEYEYRGEARIDNEMESVLKVVQSTPMRKAYMNIESKVNKDNLQASNQVAQNRQVSQTFSNNTNVKEVSRTANPEAYQKALEKVVKAIQTRNYSYADDLFTPNGLYVYEKLIKYGSAKIVGSPNFNIYDYEGGAIARGLQMAFSFKSGVRKSFVEDVVFAFSVDNKIDNISFGLGTTAENDILYKGAWDENTRKAIMNFLENYKTAYALKRIDYIRNVFDDDAVIIVGSVVKKNLKSANEPQMEGRTTTITQKGNDIIKYNRYTKDAYLKNLERSFKGNEYINLRFSDNEVRKMAKGGELYAIQIQQDYYSSSYNDQGYLFLEVDLNNPNQPSIILRTWQPEKDPDFGLYGPGDF